MRTRLSTRRRRAQLLAIGAELFARRPYEQVWIEEVAAIAQISCGLLYHYFPSKRAFFLAIVEEESAKLLHASSPDPALAPLDQLRAGLEVYIDYAEHHPDGFRVAQHSATTDHDLHRLHQARITAQRDRILAGLALMTSVGDEAKIAVTGWLAFVQTVILDWLDDPAISREQLRDLCARTLWAAVGLPADGAM
ncbi:MAG: TetR/AcrR family transcriptional regulator [Actinomycetota bacterium]|nr:TetR/AcrR family transcriptional regulator [Actinomycetota bacterium]